MSFQNRRTGPPDPQPASEQALKEYRAGAGFFNQGDFGAAHLRFAESVRLQPENADFHFAFGMCCWAMGQLDDAGPHLMSAVRFNPRHSDAQAWVGEWYLGRGMIDLAAAATAKAIELNPEKPNVMLSRAWVLEASGEMDQAEDLLQKLISGGTASPSVVRLYARLARHRHDRDRALGMCEQLLASTTLSPGDRYELHFAAANLLDAIGLYNRAFSHAAQGNALRFGGSDPVIPEYNFDRDIDFFSRQRVGTLPRATERSDKPVFIVGMPRSGTSLVEQILASHPDVHGAGELDFMHRVCVGTMGMLSANPNDYPHCLDSLTVDQATGMAQIYLQPLMALNPAARRITDKMPLNFIHLGLIALLLPDARIIHCRRDPMDNCLSCFMAHFNAGHEYKKDLGSLGRFYRQYERLMSHWKQVLDLPILDVSYEELVGAPEAQSRRLVEFIGLPWDDRCLRFHETKRAVVTESSQQVRRPMYTSSIQRWRHYEKFLGPLKVALASIS